MGVRLSLRVIWPRGLSHPSNGANQRYISIWNLDHRSGEPNCNPEQISEACCKFIRDPDAVGLASARRGARGDVELGHRGWQVPWAHQAAPTAFLASAQVSNLEDFSQFLIERAWNRFKIGGKFMQLKVCVGCEQ